MSIILHKRVTLLKNIYLTNGGLSFIQNGVAHQGIKLGASQNESSVQFPIPANKAIGKIEEILPSQWAIIRLTWSDHITTLYNTNQVNLMVKLDGALNFFFKVEN